MTAARPPLTVHGLDHVRVLARDLEAAKDHFRDRLGFALPPRGSNFGHPLGSWQTLARFRDAFYLEFLSIRDPEKARTGRPEMMAFLERFEGGHSVVLCVPSAPEAHAALRRAGLSAAAPVAGSFLPEDDAGPLSEGWWLVNFERAPFRRETVSLIEYRQAWPAQTAYSAALPVQPNGVIGGRAVWIAVPDAPQAIEHFSSMGLSASQACECPSLGGVAHELPVAPGQSLMVLEAASAGPARDFIETRGGAGVFGVTLRVAAAAPMTERAAALGLATDWHDGLFGKTLTVPAAHAMGLHLEFALAADADR
jgi:catechol 2,3-dioxygenase-like lactoylglutathione lyase family enzyme